MLLVQCWPEFCILYIACLGFHFPVYPPSLTFPNSPSLSPLSLKPYADLHLNTKTTTNQTDFLSTALWCYPLSSPGCSSNLPPPFFFFNYRGIIDIQLFSSLLKRGLVGCWFQKAETWLLHMSESLCLAKCLACSWHSNICWMNDWLSPFLHSQLVSLQCSCLSRHFSKTSLSKITSDLITKIRACLFILLSLSSP